MIWYKIISVVWNYLGKWRVKIDKNRYNVTSSVFCCMEIVMLWLKFHRYVPKGPIENRSESGQVMAWCCAVNNILPNIIVINLKEAYDA